MNEYIAIHLILFGFRMPRTGEIVGRMPGE